MTVQQNPASRLNAVTDANAASRLTLISGLLLAAYFLIWIALPLLIHRDIPGDNIEQLIWSENPALGYNKHPPFPTWILCLFALAVPKTVLLTYVLGGLQVAIMLLFTWHLAKESLGRAKALPAVLLVSCINYYAFRMHFYNHNTVLLTATAASLYCTWRCAQNSGARWWMALGLCWGIGMLSKYQMAVPIACNTFYLISVYRAEPAKLIGRLAVAGVVLLLAISPHVVWLFQNNFPTFGYASHSLAADLSFTRRVSRMASFTVDQIVRALPFLVLLGVLSRVKPDTETVTIDSSSNTQMRTFFALHAWGPLVIMLLLSLFAGVDLQTHWGTAFLWVVPLWVLTKPFGDRIAAIKEKTLLVAWSVIQILMVVVYYFD